MATKRRQRGGPDALRRAWTRAVCTFAGVASVLLTLGPLTLLHESGSASVLLLGVLVGGLVGVTVGLALEQRLVSGSMQDASMATDDTIDRPHGAPIDASTINLASGPVAAPTVVKESTHAAVMGKPPARTLSAPDRPLEAAARSAHDGLWDWDLQSGTIYLSPRWHEIAGVTDGDDLAPSSYWLDRIHAEDRQTLDTALQAHLRGELEHFACHARVRGDDGEYRWTRLRGLALRRDDGTPYRIAGSLSAVVEPRRAQSQRPQDPERDPLTNLTSRTSMVEQLAAAVGEMGPSPGGAGATLGRHVAVLLLDIDRFKFVNDSLGHAAGDEVLRATARRIETVLPSARSVARLGGDEFAVLLADLPTLGGAVEAAERLRTAFQDSMRAGTHRLFVTVSVGVVAALSTATAPDALLRDAESAMYRAKELGRDRVVVFEPTLHERIRARLRLETNLRHAIERGELLLNFQPVASISGQGARGMEALVRWQHPERGLVAPGEFIPFAEESGLIVPLGCWVLDQAIRQMRNWQSAGIAPERIAVNLSARQLERDDLPELVARLLDDASVSPRCLELELTESVIAEHSEPVMSVIRRLRKLGVQLAVDDFGTGYSSLAYLARFPVATVKVDRTFLVDIERDTVHQAIVSAVTTLAHRIGARVVAEGVETDIQLAAARSLGCDEVQGFLVSRPLDPAAATAWLEGQRRRRLLRPVRRLPGAS